MNNENTILTPEQVAQELSLKTETVRSLMRRKILPAAKVGGCWRTTRRALYGYLENQMGLESGVRVQGRKNNSKRIFQVQRRGKRMGKKQEENPKGTAGEVFFSR